jgi:hypothetical protein
MLVAIVLVILSLTLGASYGWAKPGFIVPLLLASFLFVFFFWWESRLPDGYALIPPATWRLPNVAVLVALGLVEIGWWTSNFIPFIELFAQVNGETIILAAVRTLPEGISAGLISIVLL